MPRYTPVELRRKSPYKALASAVVWRGIKDARGQGQVAKGNVDRSVDVERLAWWADRSAVPKRWAVDAIE